MNSTKSLEINPHAYRYLIYERDGKCKGKNAFSIDGANQLDIFRWKNESWPLPQITHKNEVLSYQWSRCESQNRNASGRKYRRRSKLPWGKTFFNRPQHVKKKIDRLDYIKIRNFFSSKDTMERILREATEWTKMFADTCLTNDLYTEYERNLKNQKIDIPIENDLHWRFTEKNFRRVCLLFGHSVTSGSLWTHGLQHARLSCPSLFPRVCSDSFPLSWWCHPTISSSGIPFSCPQSFPASGPFPMNWLFVSGGQ